MFFRVVFCQTLVQVRQSRAAEEPNYSIKQIESPADIHIAHGYVYGWWFAFAIVSNSLK